MKNKKIALLALGMLVVGGGASIAVQSFAQTSPPVQPSVVVSSQNNKVDQSIDEKDAQGNDLETNDDAKESIGSEKESANDNDSDSQSEQNEKDSGGGEVENANN